MTEILVWILGTFTIVFAVTVLVLLVFFYRTIQKVGKLESRIDELEIENRNLRNRPVTKMVYSMSKPKLETRGYIDVSFSDENKRNNNKNNNKNKNENNDNSSSDNEDMYNVIAETKSGDVDDNSLPIKHPNLSNVVTSVQNEGLQKKNNVDNSELPNTEPRLTNQVTTLAIEGVASRKLVNNNNKKNNNDNNDNIIYGDTNVIDCDWIRLWTISETCCFLSFMIKIMNKYCNMHDENEMNTIMADIQMMAIDGKKLKSIFEQPKEMQRQSMEECLHGLKTPYKDQLITELLKLNWFAIE